MATPSRRSVGTEQQGASLGPSGVPDGRANYVGIDNQSIEQNPDRFVGELWRGVHFKNVNTPASIPAGGTVSVSGTIHYDDPSRFISNNEARVRITSPQLGSDYTSSLYEVSHCNTRSFRVDIPVPNDPGGRFAFSVRGESKKLGGGWATNSTRGPFNVEIQSEGEAAVTEGFNYLPAAAAGAGLGYAGNQFAGQRYSNRFAAGAGALGGVAYQRYAPPLNIGGFVPDVSNVQLALVAAATFGAAYLLQSSGASEVLNPLGSAAGSAVSAGADAAGSVRQRLDSGR